MQRKRNAQYKVNIALPAVPVRWVVRITALVTTLLIAIPRGILAQNSGSDIPEELQGVYGLSFDEMKAVLFKIVGFFAVALPGVATIFFLLLSGFYYITARGDTSTMKKAKDTATYAVYGLLVIIGAAVIISMLGDLIGYDLLERAEVPSGGYNINPPNPKGGNPDIQE